jgi:hypothetical protein
VFAFWEKKMFWRKRKKKEPLPWYRAPSCKGNLTEDEKRELDSFRHQAKGHGVKHPAATFSDLPEEVGLYISNLQIELYDKIQETLVGRCFLASGVGAFLLLNYFDLISPKYHSTELFLFGAVLLSAPWVYYPIKWRKNADQHWGDTDERIRTEWELNYIVNKKTPGPSYCVEKAAPPSEVKTRRTPLRPIRPEPNAGPSVPRL